MTRIAASVVSVLFARIRAVWERTRTEGSSWAEAADSSRRPIASEGIGDIRPSRSAAIGRNEGSCPASLIATGTVSGNTIRWRWSSTSTERRSAPPAWARAFWSAAPILALISQVTGLK